MAILYFTAIIFLFVIVAFTWYTLEQIEWIEKIIYIAIGLMLSLVITVYLFNMSAKGVGYPVEEMFLTVRNAIILAIMPINAIMIMPYIGKQIAKLKFDEITEDKFVKKILIFIVVVMALAIFETKYLTNMQLGILNIMNNMS